MPIFKEMDPNLAAKLIEGYENVLDPERRKLEAFYRQFKCPKCKGNMIKHFLSIQHSFGDPDIPVPRSGLKCMACNLTIDPHSGIVVDLGVAAPEAAQKVARDD